MIHSSLIFGILLGSWVCAAGAFARDGAQVCNELGREIVRRAARDSSARWNYVYMNQPDSQYRLNVYANSRVRHVDLSQLLLTDAGTSLTVDEAKKLVYADTRSILPDWYGQVPASLRNSLAVLRALEVAEHSKKTIGSFEGSQLLPGVWIEVLSDRAYLKPLLSLAARLQEHVKLGQVVNGNFFDDLRSEFLKSGVAEKDALKMTWNVLGLYGSRGAFIDVFALHYDTKRTGIGIALSALSYLIQVVDSLNLENGGEIYSLPKGFRTRCAIGKPYHFWMSAYFSFRLHEEGWRESAAASYWLGEYYEFYAEMNGRTLSSNIKRDSVLVQLPVTDPQLDSIRLSLVLHAAGAAFGSGRGSAIVDIDAVFGQSLARSRHPRFVGWFKQWNRYEPIRRHLNLRRMTASAFIFDSIVKE
jgi:hypothetical protein